MIVLYSIPCSSAVKKSYWDAKTIIYPINNEDLGRLEIELQCRV